MIVRPKKQLGQHFLNDKNIASRIVNSLVANNVNCIIEIGPGMGVLTNELSSKFGSRLWAVEIDGESVEYLNANLPQISDHLLSEDFLNINLSTRFDGNIAIIGNLPYNISSQIFFRILEHRNQVTEVVAMVQKEVAQRIAEKPGSRTYGILSVLLQAYFNIDYLFTVGEGAFTPPPKVKSAVIRLTRNSVQSLNCDEALFIRVVKGAFNQRRKTLRNSLRVAFPGFEVDAIYAEKRAEQLSVDNFIDITRSMKGLSPEL